MMPDSQSPALAGRAAMPFWRRLPMMLLPPRCHQCGALLDLLRASSDKEAQGLPYLCETCWMSLPWSPPASESYSADIQSVWSACRYEPPVSDRIQVLKYGGNEVLGRMLGAVLGQAGAATDDPEPPRMEGAHWVDRFDWVVPVPLHPTRLRMRGFNQSLLLAHMWLGGLKHGHRPRMSAGMLRRTRATVPQVGLNGLERTNNVDDAFSLGVSSAGSMAGYRGELPLSGQRVLLVDDVWTTGATMRSCARVLREAGAMEVAGLVLASAGQA